MPSARAGVQASVRTHSDRHAEHRNSASPSRWPPVADQSQTSWHGLAARTVTHPVWPLASPVVDVRLTVWVRGRVQGVGFRWWARATALDLGLSGWAANLEDSRVEVVAEGPREACERLLSALGSGAGPGRVTGLTERWGAAQGVPPGFAER